MSKNTGFSGKPSFNNIKVGGTFVGGIGTSYAFHGGQHKWMDSAQQDKLYEKARQITKPLKRMRLYSRKLGVDPKRKDIRVRDHNGYIPADELVHMAAIMGDCQAIDLLNTRYDASVDIELQDGWRPIHRAAEGGHVKAMNMLAGRYQVDVGQRTDEYSQFTLLHSKLALLHIAASQGRLTVIDLLAGKMDLQTVEMGSLQPEGHENEKPFPATEDTNDEDANTDDEDANTEDNDNAQPLSQPEGSRAPYVNNIRGMINTHVPLQRITAQPMVRKIKWMPGDPNVRSNDKWTPMHFAALNNKRNIAKTIVKLREIGGEVDSKDIDGWTPLHMAACVGNWVAVQTLLENGADVNARCHRPYGATPLYIARLVRKSTVEKKEMDKYTLVIAILKARRARDRSAVDKYVGKYSGVLHLRGLLESIALNMVDDEWIKRFSANVQKGLTFANEDKAADFVNTASEIDLDAFIRSSIKYNIWFQVPVLSILLFFIFLFTIWMPVPQDSQIFYPPIDVIWMAVLSLFEILTLVIFGVKAGKGKPSGTIAHYLVFLFYFAIFWALTCIPVYYVFCDNHVDVFYIDFLSNCTDSKNATVALAWTVFAIHLLHILTIFCQAYRYFPPKLFSEENVVKVVIVSREPMLQYDNELPHVNEYRPPFFVQTQP